MKFKINLNKIYFCNKNGMTSQYRYRRMFEEGLFVYIVEFKKSKLQHTYYDTTIKQTRTF